jgi:hypothetical protein
MRIDETQIFRHFPCPEHERRNGLHSVAISPRKLLGTNKQNHQKAREIAYDRRADRAVTSFEMAAGKDIATDRERLRG